MDNDLMARRLRPPSEPPRTTEGNGHSPYPTDGPPWAPETDLRSDVPWDKPADEAWPPTDLPDPQPAAMEPPTVIEPDDAIELPTATEQSWPPAPAPAAEPVEAETALAEAVEAAAEPAIEPAAPTNVDRPTTWDDAPSPWDEPVAEAPARDAFSGNGWEEPVFQMPVSPEAGPEPEPVAAEPGPESQPVAAEPVAPTPVAPEPAVAEPVAAEATGDATDMTVAGRAPWDRPEPFFIDDDRPPEMLAAYDDMIPAGRPASPAPAPSTVAADLDDAFAPILGDVSQPAPPPITWSPAASPVPPADAARALGPTPPDDLFAPTAPDPGPNKPTEASTPNLYSTAPPAQPVVVRIELAIIDDSTRVRATDAARPVSPGLEPTTVEAPAPDEDDLTPRHPDFEPRTHANDNGAEVVEPVPDPAPAPVSWLLPAVDQVPAEPDAVDLPWALPPLEPSGPPPWAQPVQRIPDAPVQPVAPVPDPNPIADWTLQPTANDPLTTLPAAVAQPVVQPQPVAQPAPAPVYAAAAPVVAAAAPATARPQSDQPDLWFLSSEPETVPVDKPAREDNGEPSSLMTAGLTVLMAIVVVGLVIAFLWLMTSLPILR